MRELQSPGRSRVPENGFFFHSINQLLGSIIMRQLLSIEVEERKACENILNYKPYFPEGEYYQLIPIDVVDRCHFFVHSPNTSVSGTVLDNVMKGHPRPDGSANPSFQQGSGQGG